MSGKRRIIRLLIGPVVFALCCYALPSEIFTSVQSRAAIGTVAWVAIWWVAAPVDYAVTAFLPVVINAFIPMAEMSKVVANYYAVVGSIHSYGELGRDRTGQENRIECFTVDRQ